MVGSRQLRLTPGLRHVQLSRRCPGSFHHHSRALTTAKRAARRCCRCHRYDRMRSSIRDRSRETTSRRVGVGEDVVALVRVGDAFVVVVVGVEVEERLNATGREPSKLDEALVEVSAVTRWLAKVFWPPADHRLVEALQTIDLVADVSAKRAVSRLRAGIDRDTATGEEAGLSRKRPGNDVPAPVRSTCCWPPSRREEGP